MPLPSYNCGAGRRATHAPLEACQNPGPVHKMVITLVLGRMISNLGGSATSLSRVGASFVENVNDNYERVSLIPS